MVVTFAIPLRSKAASNDWGKVSALFNRTLASVCRQINGDFRVVVACHDVPELLPGLPLEKIEFIQVDSPLPRDYHEQMLDKGWKVHACAKWIREQGGLFHARRLGRSRVQSDSKLLCCSSHLFGLCQFIWMALCGRGTYRSQDAAHVPHLWKLHYRELVG